jgi:hypothetical protein
MAKIEECRKKLRDIDSWDSLAMRESHLPGPRAILELVFIEYLHDMMEEWGMGSLLERRAEVATLKGKT